MENAHLILPEPEEQYETLPPKWCTILILTMFVAFIVAGYLIINHWIIKVDDLQGQLWSAQTRVQDLEKENETLKCEAYFYAD